MNTWDQLQEAVKRGIIPKEKAVAVSYRARPSGRIGFAKCDKTQVWSSLFKTNPAAAWYDDGTKAFVGNRKTSMPAAIEWATKQYGITEWKGNAMGDKIPAVVHKAIPMKRP